MYTRHCQGLSGPSIKGISMPDVVIFDGTLTGLGSVHPLMVVNNVVSICVAKNLDRFLINYKSKRAQNDYNPL